jgi:hypothetical protein
MQSRCAVTPGLVHVPPLFLKSPEHLQGLQEGGSHPAQVHQAGRRLSQEVPDPGFSVFQEATDTAEGLVSGVLPAHARICSEPRAYQPEEAKTLKGLLVLQKQVGLNIEWDGKDALLKIALGPNGEMDRAGRGIRGNRRQDENQVRDPSPAHALRASARSLKG